MNIKSPFQVAAAIGTFLEDGIVQVFHTVGLFKLDAGLRSLMGENNRTLQAMDRSGLTNKNFLERYNRRNYQNPLPSPYQKN